MFIYQWKCIIIIMSKNKRSACYESLEKLSNSIETFKFSSNVEYRNFPSLDISQAKTLEQPFQYVTAFYKPDINIIESITENLSSSKTEIFCRTRRLYPEIDQTFIDQEEAKHPTGYLESIEAAPIDIQHTSPTKSNEHATTIMDDSVESIKIGISKSLAEEYERSLSREKISKFNLAVILHSLEKMRAKTIHDENGVKLTLQSRSHRNLKFITCEISLSSTLDCNFKVQPYNYQVNSEHETLINKFIEILNQGGEPGNFFMKSGLGYSRSFKITDSILINVYRVLMTTIEKVIVPQFDNFFKICTGSLVQIDQLSYIVSPNSLSQVVHELNGDELFSEKLLIERMKQHKSSFLQNRFYLNQIKFEDLKARYCFPLASSSISSEEGEEVVQQFKLLVKTLSEIGIYFKNSLESSMFKWFNERPVFGYTKPLCRVFEIIESQDQEMIKIEDLPDPHQVTPESLQVEMIPLEEEKIKERLQLYKTIRFGPIKKIFAMMILNDSSFLLTEELNCNRFKDEFCGSSEEIKNKMIKELLQVLLYLAGENCFDATFDENSFFVNEKGQIIMEVKSKQEIIPEFLPPELKERSGSSSSMVFNFGKILNSLHENSGLIQDHFQHTIDMCTRINSIERMSLHELPEKV